MRNGPGARQFGDEDVLDVRVGQGFAGDQCEVAAPWAAKGKLGDLQAVAVAEHLEGDGRGPGMSEGGWLDGTREPPTSVAEARREAGEVRHAGPGIGLRGAHGSGRGAGRGLRLAARRRAGARRIPNAGGHSPSTRVLRIGESSHGLCSPARPEARASRRGEGRRCWWSAVSCGEMPRFRRCTQLWPASLTASSWLDFAPGRPPVPRRSSRLGGPARDRGVSGVDRRASKR